MNNNSELIKYWSIKLSKKTAKKDSIEKKIKDGIFFLKKLFNIVIKPDSAS